MPLVTLTVRRPQTPEFKSMVLNSVHQSLEHVGVPTTDRFQRVLELGADDFRFDPTYPDVQRARTDDFVLIEILWSVGRSVKVKKQFLTFLLKQLTDHGIDGENVMVVFKETQWENWSFAGGRLIHT